MGERRYFHRKKIAEARLTYFRGQEISDSVRHVTERHIAKEIIAVRG